MEGLLTSTSFAWHRLPFPGADDDMAREKRMFKLLLETSARITRIIGNDGHLEIAQASEFRH